MKRLLVLARTKSTDEGTPGVLFFEGKVLSYMLELPERGNAPGRGRVFAGEYEVEYIEKSASGRLKDVYWVRDVPGRTGIFFHSGTFAGDVEKGFESDSLGCPLPALRFGVLREQFAGFGSRAAMLRMHVITGRKGFRLKIVEMPGRKSPHGEGIK